MVSTLMIVLMITIAPLSNAATSNKVNETTNTVQIESDNDDIQQFSFYTAFLHYLEDQGSLCYNELQIIRNEYLVQRSWAVKVMDATGVRTPGFLTGNTFWLGSRDTCNAARYPTPLALSDRYQRLMAFGILNETAPFAVNYKVLHLRFESDWLLDWIFIPPEKFIFWGLCLPASCSHSDITKTMQRYLKSNSFIDRKVLGINATLVDIRVMKFDDGFFGLTSVRLLLAILCFTFIMIIAASCLRFRSSNVEKENGENSFLAFIKCFDVLHNLTKIFGENASGKGEIREINAIRALNANLIAAAHVIFFALSATVNRNYVLSKMDRTILNFVFILVEAFFMLSGFLLTYNFLRNQKQKQLVQNSTFFGNVKLFFKMLLHRWLRLAPPYYVMICLNTVVHALLYRISFHKLHMRDDLLIKDTWWRFLLFIQNFQNFRELPVIWSWSMACEMQFFLIGTIMLLIYAKKPNAGKIIFIIWVLVSIASYFYNGIITNFEWKYDVVLDTLKAMYFHPFVRIISYLIGMLSAWYVVEKPGFLHPMIEATIGSLALIIFGITLSPISDSLNTTAAGCAFTSLLLRLTLTLWLSRLVVAAVTKRRTLLSPILRLKLYGPISRLSYSIYLLNPIITTVMASLLNAGINFDITMAIMWMAAVVYLTKWVAVIFSVAFELPYCNLSSLLLKSKMSQS